MRRLEPAAITGIMSREVANFRTYWKSTTFSSVLEPVVYLLAFGLGLGATVVDKVDGLEYVEFVGTGMVATAVIFSSALPAMFGTFVKHRFQRTYDAILAAPVDVEELVTAEMLWIGIRAGFYGCFPLIVAMFFGLDPAPGMLVVPLFAFVTALGFAAFGIATAATVAKIDQFSYVTTLVVTPLFLVAGTFFPIDQLPQGVQIAAEFNPLHQLVELVRHACFGFEATDLLRLAALIGLRAGALAVGRVTDDGPPDRLSGARPGLPAVPAPFQAVVFDNDGLLLDTEEAWTRAEETLFERRGRTFTMEHKRWIIGSSRSTASAKLETMLELPGEGDALMDELHELVMAEALAGVPPRPGAIELLDALGASGTSARAGFQLLARIRGTHARHGGAAGRPLPMRGHGRRRGAPQARSRPLPGGLPGARGGTRRLRGARGLPAGRGVGRGRGPLRHRGPVLPRSDASRRLPHGHLAGRPRRAARSRTALTRRARRGHG